MSRARISLPVLAVVAAISLVTGCSSVGDTQPDPGDQQTDEVQRFSGLDAVVTPGLELLPLDESIAGAVPEAYRAGAKSIKVAIYGDNAPWGNLASDQSISGFNVDMLYELGNIMNVTFDLSPSNFDQLIPSLQSARSDLALAGIFATQERQDAADLVTYGVNGVNYLVASGNPLGLTKETLCGTTVTSTSSGYSATVDIPQRSADCEAAGKDPITALILPSVPDNLLAIESGRADAAGITAIGGAATAARQYPEKYELLGSPIITSDVAAAFPKGSELAPLFQKAISILLDSPQYEQMIKTWALEGLEVDRSVLNPIG